MVNPLNADLNPICHLLALLGTHLIFHVSGLRVNLQAGRTEVRILVAARNISILQNIQVGFVAHVWVLSSSLEAKRPECLADHLPPYSGQVQNEWSCPPIPFISSCSV